MGIPPAQSSVPLLPFCLKSEKLGQNQCPCRNSASYLIRGVHAPLNKTETIIKKVIFKSFLAADGQMRGQSFSRFFD